MVRVTYLPFSKNDYLNTLSTVYNKLFPFVDLKANAAMNIIHKQVACKTNDLMGHCNVQSGSKWSLDYKKRKVCLITTKQGSSPEGEGKSIRFVGKVRVCNFCNDWARVQPNLASPSDERTIYLSDILQGDLGLLFHSERDLVKSYVTHLNSILCWLGNLDCISQLLCICFLS